MRYECDAFEGAFVEFTDSWTRGEIRRVWEETNADDYWALVCSKITACHLPTVNGEPLADPRALDNDALDALDMRLFTWLSNVVYKAAQDVQQLGEPLAAALWNISEATAADEPTPK